MFLFFVVYLLNPVGSSQLRSRSSSPWGAWLFFFSLSKNDDRSLDFICRHARFYLDHKCEINSKRLDPPRSPQGYSLPRRTHGGGPAPWILSHSNFRSGTLILSLEGWAHWILFSSYLRFGTYLIFSKVQPLDFSSNLLWLQFQRDLGAPAPEVQNICFSFLSKIEGWAPDFSSTLARFYRGPMCEINSKGSDPPRATQGPSRAFDSKEDSRGARPLDFIWSQLEVRPFDVMKVGPLNFIFILLEAWYLFYFQMPAPFSLGPTYTLDWKGKKTTLIDEFHCKTGIKL